MTTDLKVEVRNRVGILTLNRPDKLNALTVEMNEAAEEALQRFAEDPAVGCVVLTGEGRGFCAGGDVAAMHAGVEIAGRGSRFAGSWTMRGRLFRASAMEHVRRIDDFFIWPSR